MSVSAANRQKLNRFYTLQAITLLYSIVFVALIFGGYYFLLQKNTLLAVSVSGILAGIAWFSARFIGLSEGGLIRNLPLFLLLLILSAVGIFNNLMLNLEGKKIFVETIDNATAQLIDLRVTAEKNMIDDEIEIRENTIWKTFDLLEKEIRNPVNCGQGPEARKIIDRLKQQLPDFVELSGMISCDKTEEIIASYRATIRSLINNSDWYISAKYEELVSARQTIRESVDSATARLAELRQVSSTQFPPFLIKNVAPELQLIAGQYAANYQLAQSFTKVEELPARIDTSSVENLGEWSQLINLMIARMDKPQTYVYLLLAFFFDWLMVHLWSLIRENSAGLKPAKTNREIA